MSVRLEEQRRLKAGGRHAEVERLRRNRYILTSSRDTLKAKDEKGAEDIIAGLSSIKPLGQKLFKSLREPVSPRDNRTAVLDGLIRDKALLSAIDIIKERLRQAYRETAVAGMRQIMDGIITECRETGNAHFKWFARLITGHIEGILACAKHRVTSCKCEGTVNLIKTVRRSAYGFKDTDYFFLRLMDASRGYPA